MIIYIIYFVCISSEGATRKKLLWNELLPTECGEITVMMLCLWVVLRFQMLYSEVSMLTS